MIQSQPVIRKNSTKVFCIGLIAPKSRQHVKSKSTVCFIKHSLSTPQSYNSSRKISSKLISSRAIPPKDKLSFDTIRIIPEINHEKFYEKERFMGSLKKIKVLLDKRVNALTIDDIIRKSEEIGRASCRERVSSPV